MPERILLSRARGWRLPPGAVSVARPGRWGNPFRVVPYKHLCGKHAGRTVWAVVGDGIFSFHTTRAAAVAVALELFRRWLHRPGQAGILERVRLSLCGRDLACWCPLDGPCHGDVLLKIANR